MGDSVVVGVPVHNGEKGITETMTSLVRQRLIRGCFVSENRSTDETAVIVRRIIGGDPRFVVSEPNELLLSAFNFVRAFEGARELGDGPFTWVASGDAVLDGFFESGLEVLGDGGDHLLVVPGCEYVDRDTREVLHTRMPAPGLASQRPFIRFTTYMFLARWNEVYSLYTSRCDADLRMISDVFGWDVLLIWRILLRGPADCLRTTGVRYELLRPPVEVRRRIHHKLRRAKEGIAPQWFGLWVMLGREVAAVERRSVRVQARAALLVALLHPRWWQRFAEEAVRRAIRRGGDPVVAGPLGR